VHAVNKVLSFEDDEVLFDYALNGELLSAVRSLIGPRVMTISTNVFNKPPGVDGRHPLHQDLRYFSLRPEHGIIGTWTALGHVTRQNGCLALIPGSHRTELLEHRAPDWDHVNGGFLAAKGVEVDRRVHVEMEAGDTLLLHPLLVHGSGRNESSDFRRAISVHYASQECIWPSGRSRRALVVSKIDSP
jgi:phytanoyl-CoA hydroxylase